MIKSAIFMPVVAGLVSGLLLFNGTAVINRINSVSISQLPALVAGQLRQESVSASLPFDTKDLDLSQDGKTTALDASTTLSASPQVSESSSATSRTQPISSTSIKPGPTVKVTIAQMSANPSSYHGQVVTTTGRVTRLSSDKLLINDGTGQIIVDLDDDLEKVAITNGTTVTVVGELVQIGNGSAFGIHARTVTDSSSTTVSGKLGGDDSHDDQDDLDDDVDEDDQDDLDDDDQGDLDDDDQGDLDDDDQDDLDDDDQDDLDDDVDDDDQDDLDDDVDDDDQPDLDDDDQDDLDDDVDDDDQDDLDDVDDDDDDSDDDSDDSDDDSDD